MTVITMTNWEAYGGDEQIGFSGENYTEDLYIVPNTMEDYTYTLEIKKGSAKGIISLEKTTYDGSDALHVLLTSAQLGTAGLMSMQVVGSRTDGDTTYIKKSNVFQMRVGTSINADSEITDADLSVLYNYVTKDSLAAVATSGSYNDLTDTPDIDLSGYLTSESDLTNNPITVNGESGTIGSMFTAAATQLAQKVDKTDLKAVATSGSYNDLSNTPTIDTELDTTSTNAVQNAAIAIALNGKQDTLTAGSNVNIVNNVISVDLSGYPTETQVSTMISNALAAYDNADSASY